MSLVVSAGPGGGAGRSHPMRVSRVGEDGEGAPRLRPASPLRETEGAQRSFSSWGWGRPDWQSMVGAVGGDTQVSSWQPFGGEGGGPVERPLGGSGWTRPLLPFQEGWAWGRGGLSTMTGRLALGNECLKGENFYSPPLPHCKEGLISLTSEAKDRTSGSFRKEKVGSNAPADGGERQS